MAKSRFEEFIDKTVTTIIPSDFGDIEYLNSNTEVGSFMSGGLTQVTSIEFPSSIKEIGQYESGGFVASTASICAGYAVGTPPQNVASIKINEGTETVYPAFFDYCDGVKTIYIPASLTSIRQQDADGVNGTTNYSHTPFNSNGTTNYTTFVIDNNNSKYYTHGHEIITKDTYELIEGGSLSSIPSDVKIIGRFSCKSISIANLTIPSGVTKIDYGAFAWNTNIQTITFPASLTTIGSSAFIRASGITSLRFEHSASDTISMPTAGSSTGAFYQKQAKSVTIYTDNQTIHDYAWATDNITPTFYHLDGTAWA